MANQKQSCIDFIEFPVESAAALVQSKAFFSEVFGWSYKDWGEDYADTDSSGLGSGLNADPAHRSTMPLAVLFTSDIEAARAKVTAAGGEIIRDIFSFPGGRRFHFAEPGAMNWPYGQTNDSGNRSNISFRRTAFVRSLPAR